jgi:diacylglycerol kinase
VWIGIVGQASFRVHFGVALVVFLLAFQLPISRWGWCVLIVCVGLVLALELVNTVIERLTKVLHPSHDPEIGNLLDIAAGAVLVVAIAAACCGLLVLGPPLWQLVQPLR